MISHYIIHECDQISALMIINIVHNKCNCVNITSPHYHMVLTCTLSWAVLCGSVVYTIVNQRALKKKTFYKF